MTSRGGRSDRWTKAIAHIERGIVVIDRLVFWSPPFDPGLIAAESAAIGKKYRCNQTIGDRYAGEWPVAEFQKHGVRYVVCEKTKSELYLDLIPAMSGHKVELPDEKLLRQELRQLERRRGRSGKDSIDHHANGHDDLANAVAGAVNLIISKPQINKNAVPIGVGRGIGSEIRRTFGSNLSQPLLDSTFGPAPAEERPNTGCAELYGFDFGDNSEDPIPGGYVSKTLSKKRFRSIE